MPSLCKVIKSWEVEEDESVLVLDSTSDPEENLLGTVPNYLSEEVNDIIQQAKMMADEIRAKAYQDGYTKGVQDGISQGYEEGRQQVEDAYRQALQVLTNAEEHRRQALESISGEIITLGMSIAEKIIYAKLNTDDAVIARIAANTLKTVVSPRHISIHAHPKDADELIKQKKFLIDQLIEEVPVKIQKDAELPPGSCLIETDVGTVDASVTTQLKELKKALEIA